MITYQTHTVHAIAFNVIPLIANWVQSLIKTRLNLQI